MQREMIVDYVLDAGHQYWDKGEELIRALPVSSCTIPHIEIPPSLIKVRLPDWAIDLGVAGDILVPDWARILTEGELWKSVDWFGTIFWMITGLAEREFEKRHGSIHSYSFRLVNWDKRLWEYAWANRIMLFLRRWCSYIYQKDEDELFGPLPNPEIIITHDVDAIKKTMAIRLKQSAFHTFNALRALKSFDLKETVNKFSRAAKFLIRRDNYWYFEHLMKLESEYNVKSVFNFYGGTLSGRTIKQRLFDPGYDVLDRKLVGIIKCLEKNGWIIGLHQSYDNWRNADDIIKEKSRVEEALGKQIQWCRQHWLRFSWENTWLAQEKAGISVDTTLGFNDIPGFRNSAALKIKPWYQGKKLSMHIIPMVLMDSHLYDYLQLDENERWGVIKKILNEVKFTHGQVSVIWHPHVLSEDYGWEIGLLKILEYI